MSTLYEDVGGQPGLQAVVRDFSAKVLDDPRLTGYFAGIGLAELRRAQVAVFASALGARTARRGRSHREHADHNHRDNEHPGKEPSTRGIDHAEFDLVICHLADSLRAAGVPDALMTDVLLTIAPLARDTVPAPGGSNRPQRTHRLPARRGRGHRINT